MRNNAYFNLTNITLISSLLCFFIFVLHQLAQQAEGDSLVDPAEVEFSGSNG